MLRTRVSWAIACFASSLTISSQATEPVAMPPRVEQEQLVELGRGVADSDEYLDNSFLYEDRVQELTEQATSMAGSRVDVTAKVTRVTPVEVFVEVQDEGKMRMILRHATPPLFGNLGTVWYGGTPSTQRSFLLSKRVGLRIGQEIDLAVAKTLRKKDLLRIEGTIEQVPIRIKHVFEPFVAAVVTDWKVVDVEPANDDEPIGY